MTFQTSERSNLSWIGQRVLKLPMAIRSEPPDENILVGFLVNNIFHSRNQHDPSAWWVNRALQPKTNSKTSRLALIALAITFYGRAHRQANLLTEGRRLYGKALPQLRDDLMDPSEAWSFETLASVTILGMYESVAFTSGAAWIQHAGGLGRLMEARGPWRHKSGPGKSLFLELRVFLSAKAITFRKGTFLAQEIWKKVPWEDDPSSKNLIDFLLDIVCDIAGLLEETDTFLSSRSYPLGYSQEALPSIRLQERAFACLDSANTWWHKWENSKYSTCSEVTPGSSTSTADKDRPLYLTLLWFDNIWGAFMLALHNAGRIMIIQLLEALQIDLMSTVAVLDEYNFSPLLGISSDKRGLANEICRCVEYCQLKSRKYIGTFCLLFPLKVAYECLESQSRAGKWLWNKGTSDLANVSGFEIGRDILKSLPSLEDASGEV